MRIIFISFLLISLTFSLSAIDLYPRPKVGLNISQHYGIDYGYEQYEVKKGIRTGVTAGLAFDFPITDLLTISQEFLYTNKGSRQKIKLAATDIELDVFYQTDYLEFPTIFILRYYRNDNFVLSYQTGFSLSYLIQSRYELNGLIETGAGDYELDIDKRMNNIDQFDFGIILGGGVEFPFFNRRFSIDYRVNFGIPFIELPTTEDVFPEEQTASRVKLRNQSYSLSLGYFF